MKEVLFIAHRLPFPPNKGEKLRAYHFLKFIANRYQTHLVCHVDEKRDLQILSEIDLPLKSFHYFFSPKKSRQKRCLKALLSGRSLTVSYFYDSSLQKVVNSILQRPIYFVFCSCAPSAEYIFRAKFSGFKIMDFMDVDSEKWSDLSKKVFSPMRFVYSIEAKRLKRYEERISRFFDRLLFVTREESFLFKKRVCDTSNVYVIENGVDLERFSPGYVSSLAKNGPTLVFTGSMDYWPNVDGVVWFVKNVFPLIQRQVPHVRFFIVGKDPLSQVKKLAKYQGVIVTGYVDDVRDYLSLADISVVPLRIARGIQNKVLEAMAMAKPVVATSQALEGIEGIAEKHFLIANTPEEFAQKIIDLLQNPSLSSSIGQEARKLIEKHYSWERQLSNLAKVLP